LAGAADAEGEAVFPGAIGSEDAPVVFFADFPDSGEGVDEGFVLAEVEEGKVGVRVGEAVDGRGDFEVGEAEDFFVALVIFAHDFRKDLEPLAPVEAGAEAVVKAEGLANLADP